MIFTKNIDSTVILDLYPFKNQFTFTDHALAALCCDHRLKGAVRYF
jgi:hypothetical protein